MRILFKGGLLYDGLGGAPAAGDLLIQDERILLSGGDIDQPADRIIDCRGLCVTPRWIDAHSHNDFFYDREDAERFYAPFLRQGITTQVTGNCGFSVFGVEEDSAYKKDVGGGLFRSLHPGSYAEFCRTAEGRLLVNIAPLIGHGTARISISGRSSRRLDAAELQRELDLVDEAMDGGAFGGSFGFMYEPGMYAPRDELLAFAKKIGERGGILTVHPRACSRMSMDYPLFSKPHIELALDEVLEIAKAAKVKTEYSHLIFVGETSWKCIDTMLDKFYQARRDGIDIAYDNYSFLYGASVITVICPAWYMAMDADTRRKPLSKARLRVMVNLSRKLLGIDYEDLTVAWVSDEHREFEGRNVAEIAKSKGRDPLDMYLELIELSEGRGRVYLGRYYSEALLKRLMADDLSVFMTDAWVEETGVQNGAAFQCFPNFLLMAERDGLPLERAIYKMTGATAERFGIPERGRLKAGCYADVTVFDKAALSVDISQADRAPGGIRYVMVNGGLAVDDGQYQTQRGGKVLKKS